MNHLAFFITTIFLLIQSAQAQRITQRQAHPSVKLFNSHQHQFHSKVKNQSYEIYIALPDNYFTSDSTYPVLYLTDGNTHFGMMTDIARSLQWGGEMPETIIVGIGYPLDTIKIDDNRITQWLALRMHDLTPSSNQQIDKDMGTTAIKSGGAPLFLSFIGQELIPFIDKSYRTKPNDKTLAGFSLGGLFGLYTLFHQPELFQRYLIGSPSVWYDNKLIIKDENAYAKEHRDLNAMIFLSAGSLEEEVNAGMVRNMLEISSLLKSRQYKQLRLRSSVLEGESHMSAVSGTFQQGLRFFFNTSK